MRNSPASTKGRRGGGDPGTQAKIPGSLGDHGGVEETSEMKGASARDDFVLTATLFLHWRD